ncbi:hypothetical protein OAV46_05120 [Euryarchaeota archaeon]|nr:hypothetical protein [Euryarchaeota archaeon]
MAIIDQKFCIRHMQIGLRAENPEKYDQKKRIWQNLSIDRGIIFHANPFSTHLDDIVYANNIYLDFLGLSEGYHADLIDYYSIGVLRRFLLSPDNERKLSAEDCDFVLDNMGHEYLIESIGKNDTTIEEARRLVEKYQDIYEATEMIVNGVSEKRVDLIISIAKNDLTIHEARRLEEKYQDNYEATDMIVNGVSEKRVDLIIEKKKQKKKQKKIAEEAVEEETKVAKEARDTELEEMRKKSRGTLNPGFKDRVQL